MFYAYIVVLVVVVCLGSIGVATLFMRWTWSRRRRDSRRTGTGRRRHQQSAESGEVDGGDVEMPEARLHLSAYAKRMEELLRVNPDAYTVPLGNVIVRKELSSAGSPAASTNGPPGLSTNRETDSVDGADVCTPYTLSRLGSDYTAVSVAANDEPSEDITVTDFTSETDSSVSLATPADGRSQMTASFARGRTENITTPAGESSRPSWVPDFGREGSPQRPAASSSGGARHHPYSEYVEKDSPGDSPKLYPAAPHMALAGDDEEDDSERPKFCRRRSTPSHADRAAASPGAKPTRKVPVRRVHHRRHLNSGGYIVITTKRAAGDGDDGQGETVERRVLQRRSSMQVYGRGTYLAQDSDTVADLV